MSLYFAPVTRIAGYDYQADRYCRMCIIPALGIPPVADHEVEAELDRLAAAIGVTRADESSFDLNDFPKVLFVGDSCQENHDRCCVCHEDLCEQ